MGCQLTTGCNKRVILASITLRNIMIQALPPLWRDLFSTDRGQHCLNKWNKVTQRGHRHGHDQLCVKHLVLNEWMNEWMAQWLQAAIVQQHWRQSSHAVHYPAGGQTERDPKRPLIIIPFRDRGAIRRADTVIPWSKDLSHAFTA